MRNLNTRRWSTPLTMGADLFVVITGLLMFFVAERPFKFAHELRRRRPPCAQPLAVVQQLLLPAWCRP